MTECLLLSMRFVFHYIKHQSLFPHDSCYGSVSFSLFLGLCLHIYRVPLIFDKPFSLSSLTVLTSETKFHCDLYNVAWIPTERGIYFSFSWNYLYWNAYCKNVRFNRFFQHSYASMNFLHYAYLLQNWKGLFLASGNLINKHLLMGSSYTFPCSSRIETMGKHHLRLSGLILSRVLKCKKLSVILMFN